MLMTMRETQSKEFLMAEMLTPMLITAEANPPRIRLEYLDGLRGLAALFVVIHHIYFSFCAEVTLPHRVAQATYFLYLGRSAVDIFIVLSGYCLMLPVVRNPERQLTGGLKLFFIRRAKRILPAYYAALSLSYILIAACPWLRYSSNSFWNGVFPASSPGVIVSHLLLAHNLSPLWAHKVNYALWSVATEWQIYFAFALFLLPIWRRFGALAAVGAAFATGFMLLAAFPQALSQASPHFLGLFALGMLAADINFLPAKRVQSRLRWGIITALFFLPLCIPPSIYHRYFSLSVVEKDLFVGLGTASLLAYCTQHLQVNQPHQPSWVLGLLQSNILVFLGSFSYSMYLIHAPLVASVQPLVLSWHLSPAVSLIVLLSVALPVILGSSYLFHLAFERPFMRVSSRRHLAERKAEEPVSIL